MNIIVEIKNLVKKFPIGNGFFTALKGVNLVFTKGEFAGYCESWQHPDWQLVRQPEQAVVV